MEVCIEESQKTVHLEASTVKELLAQLNIKYSSVIVSRNGALVIESSPLKKEDKIVIIPVVSGG